MQEDVCENTVDLVMNCSERYSFRFEFNFKMILTSVTTTQILKEKALNGNDSYTFIERLLDISNENPKFTHEDVIAETATILTGVTFGFKPF